MRIASSIRRVSDYYSRHGFSHTIGRAVLQIRRMLFCGRMVVFYCDLSKEVITQKIPSSVRLVRLQTEFQLNAFQLQQLTSFWNPKQVLRNIRERFEKGASLWLIESGETLAGYGWTIKGGPIAPYYFPLGPEDVQLFDFYVFPKFRGRGIYWILIRHILSTATLEGCSRAFADTGEWNQPQLAAFKLTPFRRLGSARTFTIMGRKLTYWAEEHATLNMRTKIAPAHAYDAALRSHEQ